MTIILIGPRGIGKTTVAGILSEKLCVTSHSLDSLRARIYGDDLDSEGIGRFSEEGSATIVEKVLEEYGGHNCILDFGCIHSMYTDQKLVDKIETLLNPFENTFLLLPTINNIEAAEILFERNKKQLQGDDLEAAKSLNQEFLSNSNIERFSKKIIYTKNMTPEELAEEIIKYIS